MGVLQHEDGQQIVLPSYTLIGRKPSCFLTLRSSNVSGEHAVIAWQGTHWTLRDLGSRNGTTLDGAAVQAAIPLHAGAQVTFGDRDEAWVLVDDGAPEPMAIDVVSREVRAGSGGMLALPDEEHPVAVVYTSAQGGWVVEQDQQLRALSGSMEPIMAGSAWMVFLPGAHELTPHAELDLSVTAATFQFFVSRNEEHVRIVVSTGTNKVVLEAREHYYPLLMLARARAEQRERPTDERGWVSCEALVRRLKTEMNTLDVAIHRSRRRLETAGVLGSAGIVEVRRGERRFGTDRIQIVEE